MAPHLVQKRHTQSLCSTYEQIEDGVCFGIKIDGTTRLLKKVQTEQVDERFVRRGYLPPILPKETLIEILHQLCTQVPKVCN